MHASAPTGSEVSALSSGDSTAPTAADRGGGIIRLLSLNIQVGLNSSRYAHLLTHAWRHAVPTQAARQTLDRIADLAAAYDLVALQEADAGSLRTARLNQVAHLAERAGFPHWEAAVTRDLHPFARHCLGCLSRWPLESVRKHALPGWPPGRGALDAVIRAPGCEPLRLMVVHLALGRGTRTQQLAYLARLVEPGVDTVILGDLNCDTRELEAHTTLRAAGLRSVHGQPSFPSWRPSRALDHVLVSPTVEVISGSVIDTRLSDHLPVTTELRLRMAPGSSSPDA